MFELFEIAIDDGPLQYLPLVYGAIGQRVSKVNWRPSLRSPVVTQERMRSRGWLSCSMSSVLLQFWLSNRNAVVKSVRCIHQGSLLGQVGEGTWLEPGSGCYFRYIYLASAFAAVQSNQLTASSLAR